MSNFESFTAFERTEINRALGVVRSDLAVSPADSDVHLVAMTVHIPATGAHRFMTIADFGEDLTMDELQNEYANDANDNPGVIVRVIRILAWSKVN